MNQISDLKVLSIPRHSLIIVYSLFFISGTMFTSYCSLLVLMAVLVSLAASIPLPQLSESEFRGFPDDMEEAENNKVEIYSGYSNVSCTNTNKII
jgi:hypothetical protein